MVPVALRSITSLVALALVALAILLSGCRPKEKENVPGPGDVAQEGEAERTPPSPSEPSRAPEPALFAETLALGDGFGCAQMSDGGVRCWGGDQLGALGDGEPLQDSATPVDVAHLSNVVQVVASSQMQVVCARSSDEEVFCWGDGAHILGVTKPGAQPRPVAIPALSGAQDIALGAMHGCAVMRGGGVVCWGDGTFGQMGDGAKGSAMNPVTTIPGISDAIDVDAGRRHACAMLQSGGVTCWGWNGGRVSNPDDQRSLIEPGRNAMVSETGTLSLSFRDSCVLHPSGTVTCWGRDVVGPVSGLEHVSKLSGSREHRCAIADQGKVTCWGVNSHGQLGREEATASPMDMVEVAGIRGARDIGVGVDQSCAVLDDGSVACWGFNHVGQLGDGTLRDSVAPALVRGITQAELGPPDSGKDRAQQPGKPQTWPEELPKKCVRSKRFELRGRGFVKQNIPVRSAYEAKLWGTPYIILTTYHNDPSVPWEPRGNQIRLLLQPHVELGESEPSSDLEEGTYAMGKDAERSFTIAFNSRAHSGSVMGIDGDEQVLHIDYVDDQWVCGSVNVFHPEFALRGAFAAQRLVIPEASAPASPAEP